MYMGDSLNVLAKSCEHSSSEDLLARIFRELQREELFEKDFGKWSSGAWWTEGGFACRELCRRYGPETVKDLVRYSAGFLLPERRIVSANFRSCTCMLSGFATGKIVCAEDAGKKPLIANRLAHGGDWEKFALIKNDDGSFSLRSAANGKYVSAMLDNGGVLLAQGERVDLWEKFDLRKVESKQGAFTLWSYAAKKYVSIDETKENVLIADRDVPDDWELFSISAVEGPVWSDEFDGNALDENSWGFDIGTGMNGWGNNERQFYTDSPKNVFVKDSMLHIRALREDFNGAPYTSARILTKDKFSFTYGVVEARIALPLGKGIWPAFWMLGSDFGSVGWPKCGEIDIVESINEESVVYGTNHWENGALCHYGNSTKNHHGTSIKIDIRDFHTYRMVKSPLAIEMFVDGFLYHRIDILKRDGDMAVFHHPFFFILNVAVGGQWPGFNIDDAQFPAEMLVDYIRVYNL